LFSTVVALLIVKTIIWTVALGSGTSGGVLAPLLMLGAGLGCVIGPWLPGGDPELWALVCMAATLGGMMRAPLTAVVFAFGLTHDANAFLPTLLGCTVAYGFTVIAMPRSILTEKIARRGQHVYREYGIDPLETHFIDEVMTHEVVAVAGDATVANVLAEYFGANQKQRAYPVVADGQLLGIVDRASLQLLEPDAGERTIANVLAGEPPSFALATETCRAVASRMAAFGLERLAVVDAAESQQLIGLVSRSDLLKPARKLYEEESHRERLLRPDAP
jgi:CBS domain-containing protein